MKTMNLINKSAFIITIVMILIGLPNSGDTYAVDRPTSYAVHGKTENYDHSKFQCEHGKWIEWPLICDGQADCVDASDETTKLCSNTTCDEVSHFKCDYGACINMNFLCDGEFDCLDKSDETLELCLNKTYNEALDFKCNYGGCIFKDYKCDGEFDCWDESDETSELCQYNTCNEKTDYRCNYGGCVEIAHKCDGKFHCWDHSDEGELAGCYSSVIFIIMNTIETWILQLLMFVKEKFTPSTDT